MTNLPNVFQERLQKIIPQKEYNSCLATFSKEKKITLRINSFKIDVHSIEQIFKDQNISFQRVPWLIEGMMLEQPNDREKSIFQQLQSEGKIYQQSLSSMLVSLILNPQEDDRVLDMCAAPGSKTTHIAAMMNNQGSIVALEQVRERFYKLKSVVNLLGAQNIFLKWIDARKFRSEELFDKILVDAPCSSEGRFHCSNEKTFRYWSVRKVKEMEQKQKGLLMSASRLLKVGGTLVYSTCTFSPEENEGVIDWFLRKTKEQWDIVSFDDRFRGSIKIYPCILQWNEKAYNQEVNRCIRILPTEIMDGFFITKLIKKG